MKMLIKSEVLDVAWLLWLDAIERLDTILLEVRHSQINLIHALRSKELYRPLQYEEEYLWGSYAKDDGEVRSWHDLLGDPTTVREMERWVGAWIIPFPAFPDAVADAEAPPPHANATQYCRVEKRNRYTRRLRTEIYAKVRDGHWTADSRRLYHALCSLQQLKSHVLRDKLVLCRWGIIAMGSRQSRSADHPEQRKMALGRFLMTRSAVLAAAHRHIQNLGDLKAQFESALDLGIQDHPKPMTRRRREQGLYSSYLSDRCRDLGEVLEDFLFESRPRAARREGAKPKKFRGGRYAHRWSHSATSSASVMRDEIDRGEWREKQRDTDLVNTSFWMPDRPDLQSIIAHEVAHTIIHHAFGGLEPYVLRDEEGDFPLLVRLFSAALDEFGMVRYPGGDPRYAHDHALTELTCDLLAATVTGPAYLFALVQEIIGLDLDCLFHSPQHDIDFDLADFWLDDGWAALNLPGFEWYYRLQLTCEWTRGITPRDDHLAHRLIDGVKELCEILLFTVGRLGPKGVESHLQRWRVLTTTMTTQIRGSEALEQAKRWREKAARTPKNGPVGHLSGEQLTANVPLPDGVAEALRVAIVHLKTKEKRLLHDMGKGLDFESLWKMFATHYVGGTPAKPYVKGNLFRHVHDIPWQAALLRARDFLHHADSLRGQIWDAGAPGAWLLEMHTDGAPGRELYQIALEFDYWLQMPPVDPISKILRSWGAKSKSDRSWRAALLHDVRDDDGRLLKQWLPSEDDREPDESPAQTEGADYDRIRTLIQHHVDALRHGAAPDTFELVRSISPADIIAAPLMVKLNVPSSQGAQRSFFIDFQKHKLLELRQVVARYRDREPFKDILGYLDSAIQDPAVTKEVLSAFFDTATHLPTIMMLERTAASQLMDYAARQETGPFIRHRTSDTDPHSSYHPLLGRYDLFGLSHSDLTFRPRLPKFGNGSEQPGEDEPLPPPFFVRHELAIAFRLGEAKPALDSRSHVPLAFLSVTLSSRSDRLSFLYRLRMQFRDSNPALGLNEDDLVLLSEGWGDVIVVVQIPSGDNRVERAVAGRRKVEAIFDMQQALFSDLLVERTELILTFACLKFVTATDGHHDDRLDLWPFSMITRLRLNKSMPSGSLCETNAKFLENLEKLETERCRAGRAFDVVRTPGRTDFTIYFRCRHVLEDYEFRKRFFGEIGRSDDVLTVIGYRENLRDREPPRSFHCAESENCPHRRPALRQG